MTDKHTPGPWSINNWPQASTDIAIGAAGTPLIAKVALRDVSINEHKANAYLIAAAPEMLEALQDIAAYYQNSWAADRANRAIAKAIGEKHD